MKFIKKLFKKKPYGWLTSGMYDVVVDKLLSEINLKEFLDKIKLKEHPTPDKIWVEKKVIKRMMKKVGIQRTLEWLLGEDTHCEQKEEKND